MKIRSGTKPETGRVAIRLPLFIRAIGLGCLLVSSSTALVPDLEDTNE